MSIIEELNNDEEIGRLLNSDNEDFEDTIAENVIVSQRKKLKKRSSLWQYYYEITENGVRYAKCKLCIENPKKYRLSGKSNSGTGNMSRHLQKCHVGQVVLGALDEDDENFVFSQEKFRKALIKWIVMCDQPFTEPQQQTFADLVRTLNPNAQLISDKTVRADIIATYEEKFVDVKDLLAQIPGKISITFDGWTSRNVLPFLAFHGHWLDTDWKYHSILFDFSYIHGKHSGWKHSCIFRDCLSRLNIATTKILGVTGDNAGSNDTFFDWMEEHGLSKSLNQIRCLCHVFNLAVQDLLALLKISHPENDVEDVDDEDLEAEDFDFENEVLEDIDINEEIIDDEEPEPDMPVDDTNIIIKLRKVVKKIRKSVKLRQKLKKCCIMYKVPYHVPIIDVKTRWNSTYYMILRAEELKVPLRVLCVHEQSLISLQITDEEWTYLAVVEKLLQKFDRATKLMSMERHSTIHSYIPTLNWMIDSVQEFANKHTGTLRHAAHGALLKLRKYKINVDQCVIPFIATILHPALKLNYFKEHGYSTSEVRDIKKAVSEYFTTNYKTNVDDDGDVSDVSGDDLYVHIFKRSRIERTSSEFEKYLNLPLVSRKVDPLDYWKSQIQQFPCLTNMARDVLPAQSSSTCVERDFSKGSQFVTPTRCSMSQTTIRASMSLKSWYSMT